MHLSPQKIEASKHEAAHFFAARAGASCFHACERQRGFTLVELIMVMVIVGVMAVVVAPKFFDNSVFQSRGFADQVQATLRFAQKTAIAQRHFVCVAFGANSVTLTYDPTSPNSISHPVASCPGVAMSSPAGETPYTVTAPTGVTLGGGADFYFDPLGRPSMAAKQVITVGGSGAFTIEAETGYVHQ